ncbi:MAG: YegS/Rv2252/BmrU family lipid kinase [Clostridia bacterium]|nr:YegS/Rv2252/BmrU family lipid kinase [Clostridia bacterium]
MENKKLLLIVNPKSGREKMRGQLLRVTEILSKGGFDVTVYPTKARGDGTVRAAKIKQNEFDRVVVCGGDGTLNEVITGLMQSGVECTLGYIPSGTLNEWSAGLHIARDIPSAAKDIVNGEMVELDIGKFGDKYFSYTASFGAFTEASYSAPQDVKNVLGQAAYFFEGIKSLGNIKPIHLKFTADDREIEGDFLFGAISNSMSVGGIVKFNDANVELNDGLFEVVLIKNPANLTEFQSILDGIIRQDLGRKGLEFFHTKAITVSGGKDVSWTLDGEFAEGSDEIRIENIHSAIKLIVPES